MLSVIMDSSISWEHHIDTICCIISSRLYCLIAADFSEASISLFSKPKWIPIFDIVKYREVLLLFSVLLPMPPVASATDFSFFMICDFFDLKVPFPLNNFGKQTLAYNAMKLFNDLSSDLKEFSLFFVSADI